MGFAGLQGSHRVRSLPPASTLLSACRSFRFPSRSTASRLLHPPSCALSCTDARMQGEAETMCSWLAFATTLHVLFARIKPTRTAHFKGHRLGHRSVCLERSRMPLLTFTPTLSTLPGPAICSGGGLSPGVSSRRHTAHQRRSVRFLSWDFPKIAPPSSDRLEVHSRSTAPSKLVVVSLREESATPPPCSVPAVSHHLDGLLLQHRARVLQRAADHGVHYVSRG